MKFKIFVLAFLCFFSFSYAEQVDSVKAIKIATHFFNGVKPLKTTHQFKLVRLHQKQKSAQAAIVTDKPSIYILNNMIDGFVIVSGDDRAKPILAYAVTGKIDPFNIPPAMAEWLKWKEKEIKFLSEGTLQVSKSIAANWANLENNIYTTEASMSGKDPLIKTYWGQGLYYNDLCPTDTNSGYSNDKVPVGCVATAMAQLMKYWEYPATGTGNHSYTHAKYGTLSANFGTTTYDWASMPNAAFIANNAVATLSYHCGVSINMNYGPTGSSANLTTAGQSLINYFQYKNTLTSVNKSNYTATAWNNLIKSDIDNNLPVLLRGSAEDGSEGHAYICDGYTVDNYFHINWGWNASYNGYFIFDDLTPGSNDFTYYQGAVIGIKPSGNSCAVYPAVLSLASGSGSNGIFRITSTTNWTISSDQTWLSTNVSSGTGSTFITVTTNSQNNTGNNRTATISITADGLAAKTILVTQVPTTTGLPNLSPFKYSTWSDKIVVSNVKSTLTDNSLVPTDSVYVDYGVVNNGSANINGIFNIWLALDSVNILEAVRSTGLNVNYYTYKLDIILGRLTEGTHKLKLVADPLNDISESNENDNVYIKTITVASNGTSYLYASTSSLNYDYKSASKTVNVTSNSGWNVSSDQTWLVPNITSGTNNGNVVFSASENTTLTSRTATITLSGTGLTTVTINVTQAPGLPNLTPYKPSTWGDKIVISNLTNTFSDNIIYNTQTVYIDYCIINNGNKRSEGTFYSKLYLNNVLKHTLTRTDTLGSGWYVYFRDFTPGILSAGIYTVKIVTDEVGTIVESNETDNVFEKQFTVYDAATSLSVTPATTDKDSKAEDIAINITCIGNWNITNSNSWITLSSVSGSGNGQVTVSVAVNPNLTARTGKFTISNGVITKEITINQSASSTGFDDIKHSPVRVFPNPVEDKLYITNEESLISNITIINSTGVICKIQENCGNQTILDVASLPAGYYILTITTNNVTYKSNFIKL